MVGPGILVMVAGLLTLRILSNATNGHGSKAEGSLKTKTKKGLPTTDLIYAESDESPEEQNVRIDTCSLTHLE